MVRCVRLRSGRVRRLDRVAVDLERGLRIATPPIIVRFVVPALAAGEGFFQVLLDEDGSRVAIGVKPNDGVTAEHFAVRVEDGLVDMQHARRPGFENNRVQPKCAAR